MSVLSLMLGATVITLLTTGWVRWYAIRRGILDVPNYRSSHTRVVPRGGGLVIALAWIGGSAWWLSTSSSQQTGAALALLGGGSIVALAGWWDDVGNPPRKIRFLLHTAAAILTIGLLGGFPTVRIGTWIIPLGIGGSILAVLGIVWMINLYNFMDGIDGLAGIEALTCFAFLSVVFGVGGEPDLAALNGLMGGATLGFLIWNYPPAKIFMGDVGSGLLGYAFATLAVLSEKSTDVPLGVVLVPLSVFIIDATYTLLCRFFSGEKVYTAHRSHVYQRLVQRGWTHLQVDLAVLCVNLVLCAFAWLMWVRPGSTLVILSASLLVVMLVGSVSLRFSRLRPEFMQ